MQALTWTVSGLSVEFGIDRRTVARRLEGIPPDETGPAGRKRWLMRRAAPALLGITVEGGEHLNAEQQRARKDKEHADKLSMENALRRGELVDVGEVGAHWAKLASEVRSKILGVPTKAAPLVIGFTRLAQVQDVLEKELHAALGAIADPGPGVSLNHETAAAVDSEPMGGPKPKAKSRS